MKEKHENLLVFLALCAFIEEDGYAHFGLNDLKKCGLGTKLIKRILTRLENEKIIKDYTINGYFKKYYIYDPKQCPDVVFDEALPFGPKMFIIDTFLAKAFEKTSIRLLVKKLYNDIDYKSQSHYNSRIKEITGNDVFTYAKNIKYVTKQIDNIQRYEKTENGYRSKLHDKKRKTYDDKKKTYIDTHGVYKWLLYKIQRREKRNPERFKNIILTENDIKEIWDNQNGCDYYTNVPFDDYTQISVDRINSEKGYIKNNIVLTTWEVNKFKNNIDEKRFFELCNIIAKAHPV